MSKTTTITSAIAAAAVLAAHSLTPAAAAPKALATHEQEAVQLAPPGVDIVEHRGLEAFRPRFGRSKLSRWREPPQ